MSISIDTNYGNNYYPHINKNINNANSTVHTGIKHPVNITDTPDSDEAVGNYFKELESKFPEINFIINEYNFGSDANDELSLLTGLGNFMVSPAILEKMAHNAQLAYKFERLIEETQKSDMLERSWLEQDGLLHVRTMGNILDKDGELHSWETIVKSHKYRFGSQTDNVTHPLYRPYSANEPGSILDKLQKEHDAEIADDINKEADAEQAAIDKVREDEREDERKAERGHRRDDRHEDESGHGRSGRTQSSQQIEDEIGRSSINISSILNDLNLS